MKSSLASREESPRDDSSDDDHHDDQSTYASGPTRSETVSTGRPHLTRTTPSRLAEVEQPAEHGDTSIGSIQRNDSSDVAAHDGASDERKKARTPSESNSSTPTARDVAHMAAQGNLAELKDALSAKMKAQVRSRKSYGSGSAKSEAKRVSPIREEAASQSAQSSGASAVPSEQSARTSSTVSTESTESNRTVRGTQPPTPAAAPLRTPSYPFPYVPGTPRMPSFPGSHHGFQPFTALSPTVSNQPRNEADTPRGRGSIDMSGGSTPAAHTSFLPANMDFQVPDDPRYPAPNLYDLVLQLNAEPGLEQWWATVTNIMHDHFKAERSTVVQPIDPTDIENVPWGQKMTFSLNGREDIAVASSEKDHIDHSKSDGLSRPELVLREPSRENTPDTGPRKLHPERLRPHLGSRHSYAGHGHEIRDVHVKANDVSSKQGTRPQGPQRTVTHAAGITGGVGPGRNVLKRSPSAVDLPRPSLSEQDFSSATEPVDDGPHAEVFDTIRPLDCEVRPLIESAGVNRVLERGRVVTVTRDYAADTVDPSVNGKTQNKFEPISGKSFGNYRRMLATDELRDAKDYEEYEQQPASPWAQSPAPSPAIQKDEERNPFFAQEDTQVDDAFDPISSPKDYAQVSQLEAIGVDNASSVIHIPLVHPILSQPMQSLRMAPHPSGKIENLQRSNTIDLERKAPIAILSILTSTVPYPQNLVNSLKLLGPHLATSFATAQQFSTVRSRRAVSIRHRRTASGRNVGVAPMTIEPASLEDIVHADIEQPPGSIASATPTEYSGHSRTSPTASIVGTPGWDPAAHGWTMSRSVQGTPASTGSEMVDNYFEVRKRANQRSASNASATATPARSAKSSSKNSGSGAGSHEDDTTTPSQERKRNANSKDTRSPLPSPAVERSPPLGHDSTFQARPMARPSLSTFPEIQQSKQHSLLHSYGADFYSSFGVTSTIAHGDARTPGSGMHMRKGSFPEDMPPPSERLLRTIIDSVPVQIFTAQPETGLLSWVNSKFLIYRGLEARQVLSDPWAAIHPEDRGDFLPAWQRSLRTNQQLQQKVRLQRFDGSYRWFYVRAAPLKDKRQHVVHWIGTMMDFHEQQLAEMNSARQQETEASEAKYRALANSSPQIVFAADRVKGVTFCNTQWLHYSGQTEAQALGVGFMDFVHPEDLAKCRLPAFGDGSNQPTNVPTSMPTRPSAAPAQSENSSSGSSETERPVSGSEDASAVSPASSKPPQRKLSELASTGILKVTKDADGRPSYSTEVRLKSKDGEYRWHLVRVLLSDPLLHQSEEETWYGTCTDINDHKTLERDLKETMDEKSRFLSNMSHEIRTPLNGITGMVNFLIDSSLTSEQMEHVNIIRASTEGLRGLINDILDLSKAEAGMIQLSMDWLYVRALIEEVNDLTSAMAIDKGLELNYVVEEDVPPQIKGDRFRIRQILLNVVGNAIKFTARGEVFVRCSLHKDDNVDLAKHEMFIKFEIVDTGQGFTDREAEFLFKRFSQIDGSSTRQHGGTGLGLVISRQLAQLHGGEMSAKGVPEKGSTFAFYIKTTVPWKNDMPPPPTPGGQSLANMPMSPGLLGPPSATPSLTRVPQMPLPSNVPAKASPKFLREVTSSPSPQIVSPDNNDDSPGVSSASSDPSVRSVARTSSLQSERSSASSVGPDHPPIKLANPPTPETKSRSQLSPVSDNSSTPTETGKLTVPLPASVLAPPMYSILVVAPLKYSREATVRHIDMTLPKNIPHQITARESYPECKQMLGGEEPLIFTHVVVVLQDVEEIIALMDQVLQSANSTTAIVLITDLAQRRKIAERAPHFDYDRLVADRRLRFVFKPLKPSRFGLIFDPQKEREMSLDRNQDSAQQVAVNQKQVFEELTRRLGNKDKRVLLVEDNKVNQMVILKFLAKASIKVDTVLDGVQCTDKVFANSHDHYSIILCDLHMPNKDGYQTCKEIRKWEKKNKFTYLPIIALSANVLGDVYQKCVEAGFNSYMTKPVDFKELSQVLMTFMDPKDPSKPHEFMRLKRGQTLPGLTPGTAR